MHFYIKIVRLNHTNYYSPFFNFFNIIYFDNLKIKKQPKTDKKLFNSNNINQ